MTSLRLIGPILVMVSLLACSGPPDAPPEEKIFSVRVLTTSPLTGRWERVAERGLGLIASELGADVGRVRVTDSRHILADIEVLPEAPDLIFCVGPGLENSLPPVADRLPETLFVLVPGIAAGSSVAGVSFHVHDAAYLAGVFTGALASAPVAGIIRGSGGAWLEPIEEGFRSGFKDSRRRAKVLTVAGSEGPWKLKQQGVETALYSGEWVDPAVLAAAHDAGVHLITLDPDLLVDEPEVVLAAIRIDVAEAMVRVARAVAQGEREARTFSFDLSSGVVDLDLNPASLEAADPAVRDALQSARIAVTSGVVEIESLGI